MALRICVMTSVHPPFDVRIFHKECKSLARQGHSVVLIAPAAGEGERDGVRLIPLPHWPNRFVRMVRGPAAVFRHALRQKADIYHFHDPELIPVALLLSALGKKVIYDAHEDYPRTISYKPYVPASLKLPVSAMAEWAERWASRRLAALVAANPVIAARFKNVNPDVSVVHNYPKLEEFQDLLAGRAPARGTGLAYIGMRLTRARGVEEIIRAVGLLPRRIPARLKLAGAWDPPDLPASLARIPGWERTDFLGPLDRPGVVRLLRESRIGLVVLHPEPNYLTAEPVKLFEYMAAGIPAIASDFPVWRRIIEQAQCGLLVNPLDPQAIARAVEYLWAHPEEAEAMGRRGQQAVQERYNWAHEETILFSLYRRLGGVGPVPRAAEAPAG